MTRKRLDNMKYVWEDLPEPLSCFTVVNTEMINLNTGKVVQHYSTNTKIVVVQKCVTKNCTYYRTQEAEHHYLNYAFKASAFGLPNEKAPSELSSKSDFITHINSKKANRTLSPKKKQTSDKTTASPKDGEEKRFRNWVKMIFRRKNG